MRRSSSSTFTSFLTKSTASAATRSCSNMPTRSELQQRCLKICEVGAQMRLLYTTALYHDYVAKDIPLAELEQAEGKVQSYERELLQA